MYLLLQGLQGKAGGKGSKGEVVSTIYRIEIETHFDLKAEEGKLSYCLFFLYQGDPGKTGETGPSGEPGIPVGI